MAFFYSYCAAFVSQLLSPRRLHRLSVRASPAAPLPPCRHSCRLYSSPFSRSFTCAPMPWPRQRHRPYCRPPCKTVRATLSLPRRRMPSRSTFSSPAQAQPPHFRCITVPSPMPIPVPASRAWRSANHIASIRMRCPIITAYTCRCPASSV